MKNLIWQIKKYRKRKRNLVPSDIKSGNFPSKVLSMNIFSMSAESIPIATVTTTALESRS